MPPRPKNRLARTTRLAILCNLGEKLASNLIFRENYGNCSFQVRALLLLKTLTLGSAQKFLWGSMEQTNSTSYN